MARKLFYGRRWQRPAYLDLYVFWLIVAIIFLPIMYFAGSVKRQPIKTKTVSNSFYQANYHVGRMKLYPNNWENKDSILNNILTAIETSFSNQRYFSNIEAKLDMGKFKCNNVVLSKSDPQFILLANIKSARASYYALAMAEYMSVRSEIAGKVVLYKDSRCIEDFQKSKLLINMTGAEVNSIAPVNKAYDTSSIALSYLNTKAETTTLANQMAASAFHLHDRQLSYIRIGFKGSKTFLTQQFQVDARTFIANILALSSAKFAPQSFWLSGNKKAISNFVLVMAVILGVLLVLIPAVNISYHAKDKLIVGQGIFSGLVFTLLPLAIYFLSFLSSRFISNLVMWMVSMLILSVVLYVILHNFANKVLRIKINVATSTLILSLSLIVLSFSNPILFLSLVATPVILSKCRKLGLFGGSFLAIIALLPTTMLLFYSLGSQALTPSQVIAGSFFNFSNIITISIVIGSMLSLINQEPKRVL